MEYCGCGDLAQKVERYKRRRQYIDEDVIWRYLIQCLKALSYLHAKGICHRDLKTANSFIAEDGSIKVGDMNVSKTMNKGNLKTQIGTPYYMSPEIWQNRPYDSSCDIWSLGCMIYELCALRPPFTGDSFPALKRAVTCGRYSSLPSKYSTAMHRVVANMLRLQPQSRPSADVLLRSPEVTPKLHLDSADEHANEVVLNHEANFPQLLQTIRVPQNLKKLNSALPKACYPDARPNTPSAWTVADQYKQHKKQNKAKLEEVSEVPPSGLDAASVDVESQSVQSESSVGSKKNSKKSREGGRDGEVRRSHKTSDKECESRVPLKPQPPNREYSKENLAPPRHHRQRGVPTVARSNAPAPEYNRQRAAPSNPRHRPSRLW